MEFQSRGIKVEDEPGGKRRASTEEWTANKKRALSSSTDSPIAVNGSMDDSQRNLKRKAGEDVPLSEEDVERFRKAAIFRRMRHYQREYDRAVDRYEKLETSYRQSTLQQAETEACWQSLVELIRRLANVEALCSKVGWEKDDLQSRAVFQSRVFQPKDFRNVEPSVTEKLQATEKILKAFVSLANDGKLEAPIKEVLISDGRELQQSNAFLKSETERVYELYENAQRERDKYLSELRVAERRIDRLQSHILNPLQHQSPEPHTQVNGAKSPEGVSYTNGIKEASPPAVAPQLSVNGDSNSHDDLTAMVELRESRILELERENAMLRDKKVMAETEIALLSEDVLLETPTYRVLLNHASKLEKDLSERREEVQSLTTQIETLTTGRQQWQDGIMAAATKESNELKQALKKRDEDINRLRLQRDKIEADFKELDTIQKSKWTSINKYKVQVSERRRRMEVMQSELRRLAARLAANEKQEHLLDFLLGGNDLENYPSHLGAQCRALEKEVEGLRSLVKASKSGLEDYGRLRVELESARKRLEKYESSDKGGLIRQLDAKEEEIRALKLKEKESTAAMDSLCSEVEKLSLSWEELQSQLSEQVITLEKWEEEKERLSVAKAKADNRYYKSMADAEAKEKERRTAQLALEKYQKVWETVKEAEQASLLRTKELEESVISLKSTLHEYEIANANLIKETEIANNKQTVEEKRLELLQDQLRDKEKELMDNNMAMLKLRDEVQRYRKEAERASARAKAPAGTASQREEDLQSEVDGLKKILKCSTCNHEFRNTVITKCMHSFCKGCVDARISHRQRKCPACNLAFAQSDVQPLYFQ